MLQISVTLYYSKCVLFKIYSLKDPLFFLLYQRMYILAFHNNKPSRRAMGARGNPACFSFLLHRAI